MAGRSQVPLWMVLGIVLVLISSPVVLLGDPGGFAYAFGAGVAFLIVALCQWVANRWGALGDDDVYDSEGSEPGSSTETAPTPVNLGQ